MALELHWEWEVGILCFCKDEAQQAEVGFPGSGALSEEGGSCQVRIKLQLKRQEHSPAARVVGIVGSAGDSWRLAAGQFPNR